MHEDEDIFTEDSEDPYQSHIDHSELSEHG